MSTLTYRKAFFMRFFRSPRQIGSVTPSSKYLVKALLDPIAWGQVDTLVELGAGTGVITQALESKLHSQAKAFIFEKDPILHSLLHQNHPTLHHVLDATEIKNTLTTHGLSHADAILSSLPFTNFSITVRNAILDQICSSLAPSGVFTAYQYSLQMKPLLNKRFRHVEIRWVIRNLLPAFVYICKDPIHVP
ncbi:class I SAM-dependent methyltransferase [Marininema halotolerans]|uniref:Phospholipid N-methyltransferase n=1 Tax=Marininema halotolerans TaxID=1155944 RepID=A0A1I6SJ06_9BACL|nr:methyltransferase [Marininema halotolerans]SFS76926.1 Phospholipid N-methyltransferase [Marininema halotolerans]